MFGEGGLGTGEGGSLETRAVFHLLGDVKLSGPTGVEAIEIRDIGRRELIVVQIGGVFDLHAVNALVMVDLFLDRLVDLDVERPRQAALGGVA